MNILACNDITKQFGSLVVERYENSKHHENGGILNLPSSSFTTWFICQNSNLVLPIFRRNMQGQFSKILW